MEGRRYRCGDFQLDLSERRFTRAGQEIALEPRVFAVIAQLLSRAGALIERSELLDAVWGHRYVTPSTLSRTIALARRAFGDELAEPRYIQTVHGAGYRFVAPVERIELEAADDLARFGPPPMARLPAPIDDLIGREADLAVLRELLERSRAVTVLGSGGIGKTQCAFEAARRLSTAFVDGVWFFDLAPMRSAEEWLAALCVSLAISPAEPRVMLHKAALLLQDRRALLVLDNCDRIATEVGLWVIELLRAAGSLRLLATSQVPLNFVGEHLLRLPPLPLPKAVELLEARIRAVQPAFTSGAEHGAVLADICSRLDCMPLALELAAARFSLLSPQQVHERLEQRFSFLSSDTAGRDPRHRNLLVLLDWSFSLLSSDEARLLTWCAVFVQGWTVEAAVAIGKHLGYAEDRSIDLMAGLVDRSLVGIVPGSSPPRYRLLETVREYALDRLIAMGEEVAARDAHLKIIERMCRQAHIDMLGGHMTASIERMREEHGNIGAALAQARGGSAERNAGLGILGALTLYVKAHGAYVVAGQWSKAVLAESEGTETVERGRALLCEGVTQMHLVRATPSAEVPLREAARIAALHEDRWAEGYAHGYWALWLANWDRPEEALEHGLLTERRAAELGDSVLAGLAGLAHGWIHLARGDPRRAVQALGAVRELGPDLHQRHFIDMYIALALFRLGEEADSAQQWLNALTHALAVHNVRGAAGSVEGCGYLACRRHEWGPALRFLAAAGRVRERTEVPLFRFWLPHHEAAHAALRTALGVERYHAAIDETGAVRDEQIINEARTWLSRFAAGASGPAAALD